MSKFRLKPLVAAAVALHAVPVFAQEVTQSASEAQASQKAERAVALPQVRVEDAAESPYKADTVSSPKFTEPLLNTPQTISVIKKEVLAEQGAVSLTDALRNTPGITFTLGENGATNSGDTIFMRGFDTSGSIFLDNIRDLGAAVRDTFNIEQIEIVKGPSGADNGRGATSGYINLASKLPVADNFQAGTLSYGTEKKRRVTADLNQQIGTGAAVRLNLVGQDGGVAGRDFIERQSWGIAPSVAFGLGSSTRVFLFSQHVQQNNTPDGGVSAVGLPVYRFSNSVVNPVQQALDAAGVSPEKVDTETFYGTDQDFEDIHANMFTAKFEHDLKPDFVVRNISRYGKSEQERVLTAPSQAPIVTSGSPGTAGSNGNPPIPPASPLVVLSPDQFTLARSVQASYRTNEILTNQTSLTADVNTGSIKHTVGGGFEFIYETQLTPTYAAKPGSTALAATNLYNPDRTAVRPEFVPNGAYSDGKTLTAAVYLFDTVHLTERFQLNGGLRLERYNTDTNSVALATAAANPGLPVGSLVPTHAEAADNLFSWKAGALYKPTAEGSVYVAYANSLKPPGGDNFTLAAGTTATGANANINNPSLDPQEATNIEAGIKWDFLKGRLAATGAVFKSDNKNDLARASDDPNIVIQYGKKEVKGVELGLVGQINEAWNITAGITKQKTDVSQGSISDGVSTQTGAIIRFSPDLTATLWTSYKFIPVGLTIGGGARYIDTMVRGENNDPNGQVNASTGQVGQTGVFKIDSYTVFDAMASYEIVKNATLQLNVYNVADKDYVASVNNSGQRYFAGTPRSYLATVNFSF